MNKITRMVFGQNIKYYRKKKDWTQLRLGMELGLSQPTIAQYELGIYRKMTSKKSLQFANALDVEVWQLFDSNNNSSGNEDLGLTAYSREIKRKRRQKDRCTKRLGRFI